MIQWDCSKISLFLSVLIGGFFIKKTVSAHYSEFNGTTLTGSPILQEWCAFSPEKLIEHLSRPYNNNGYALAHQLTGFWQKFFVAIIKDRDPSVLVKILNITGSNGFPVSYYLAYYGNPLIEDMLTRLEPHQIAEVLSMETRIGKGSLADRLIKHFSELLGRLMCKIPYAQALAILKLTKSNGETVVNQWAKGRENSLDSLVKFLKYIHATFDSAHVVNILSLTDVNNGRVACLLAKKHPAVLSEILQSLREEDRKTVLSHMKNIPRETNPGYYEMLVRTSVVEFERQVERLIKEDKRAVLSLAEAPRTESIATLLLTLGQVGMIQRLCADFSQDDWIPFLNHVGNTETTHTFAHLLILHNVEAFFGLLAKLYSDKRLAILCQPSDISGHILCAVLANRHSDQLPEILRVLTLPQLKKLLLTNNPEGDSFAHCVIRVCSEDIILRLLTPLSDEDMEEVLAKANPSGYTVLDCLKEEAPDACAVIQGPKPLGKSRRLA